MIFLPLYRTVAQRLSDADWPEFFNSATVPQLAAVLFIQNAQQMTEQQPSTAAMQRQLAKLIQAGQQANQKIPQAFQKLLAEQFSREQFSAGLGQLAPLKVSLLDDEHPADEQRYLDDEGAWLFNFSAEYQHQVMPLQKVYFTEYQTELSVTDAQNRMIREFLSAPDESFNVQGYAGSGKTHLIRRFTEQLDPRRTLLLAQTSGQLQALKKRAGKSFPGMTFTYAVEQVLNTSLLSSGLRLKDKSRSLYTWHATNSQIVEWLRIPKVGYLYPTYVASICTRSVASFCYSSAQTIGVEHLPIAIASRLNTVDKAVLLTLVKRYWDELIHPSEEHIRLPIRGYHRIKLMSLTDKVLNPEYTQIIVDEGHDITAPMLQILDRSPQAVITLSDELQNLSGLAPARGDGVRQRFISQSVRLGKQVENVVNPLIQAHPSATKALFAGRADHCTSVQHYSGWQIPSQATTIIVADEFDLFTWFQRLSHAGASFQLSEPCFQDLQVFAKDCIELYLHDTQPRHGLIFRYTNWNALSNAMADNPSFQAIERMLESGYSQEDFQAAVDNYKKRKRGRIVLARVGDTKNMEFSSVYLSKNFLVAPTDYDNQDSRARLFSKLYTACTRAQHELIVPEGFSDWITDVVK